MVTTDQDQIRFKYEQQFLGIKLQARFDLKNLPEVKYEFDPRTDNYKEELIIGKSQLEFSVPYRDLSQKRDGWQPLMKNLTYPEIEEVLSDFERLHGFEPSLRNFAGNYLFRRDKNLVVVKIGLDWSDEFRKTRVKISTLRIKLNSP